MAIVGVDEIDLPRNRISWISPLARTLLKAREGDTVVLRGPEGDVEDIESLAQHWRWTERARPDDHLAGAAKAYLENG